MQATSDIFLGWVHVPEGEGGLARDFYGRQLKDWKGSAEIEQMVPKGMAQYGRLCGWTLARAHARSGDRIAIAAYLGKRPDVRPRDRRVLPRLRRAERARLQGVGGGGQVRTHHRSGGALTPVADSRDHAVDVTEKLVRAAGGLVCRKCDDGAIEIVLVHRAAYDDWAFPKGKLHPGESEPQAALREVEEETGLRCSLAREVGTTGYRDPRGRPKRVRYWEMAPVGGALAPTNEIDRARWVAPSEALATLTYPRDRELLRDFCRRSPCPSAGQPVPREDQHSAAVSPRREAKPSPPGRVPGRSEQSKRSVDHETVRQAAAR